MRSRTGGGLGVGALAALVAAPDLAGANEADYQPTFAKDVAPILQQSCQECHQPNSIAPMSLLTYGDVRPWARAIRDRVVSLEQDEYEQMVAEREELADND